MLFDAKNFNGEVFGAYVDRIDNLNRNELLKSKAIIEKSQYAAMLPDQVGGNYITVPIKARVSGDADNYDGNTDIKASERKTPDYIIEKEKYDLKTPTGSGKYVLSGIQIKEIFTSDHTRFVIRIIVIRNNEILSIFKRK